MTKEFRYGDDKTIHRTGDVNIERDPKTGAVVAVWYRCSVLPFTDEVVDEERAKSMRKGYREQSPYDIKAIVFKGKESNFEISEDDDED